MTDDKEKQSQDEDPSEGSAEALAADQGGQVAALMARLEEAEAKAAEYKDGWQRAQAEFQNYKKRLDRDNESIYASMKSDILKRTLPVLDDLERALQNRPADEAWVSG